MDNLLLTVLFQTAARQCLLNVTSIEQDVKILITKRLKHMAGLMLINNAGVNFVKI